MFKTLNFNDFVIRPFERKDLEDFAHYRAQPKVAEYQSWSDYSYEDAVRLFESMDYEKFGSVGDWYQLAIADVNSDKLVGDLAVHFIDEQQVEVGFTIDPRFQGNNIATQALNCLLGYLFNGLGKHRIIAITDARNISSCRVLEKVGFRREGHYLQNIFFKGAWGDEYSYAILNSEYKPVE